MIVAESGRQALFDLGFFEFDVLARDRIVFLEHEFLGLIARVLLGHVVEARAGGAYELDLLGDGLRHVVLDTLEANFARPYSLKTGSQDGEEGMMG
jgi:hypothetical protein